MFAIFLEKIQFFNTLFHSSSDVSMDIYIMFHLTQLAKSACLFMQWL